MRRPNDPTSGYRLGFQTAAFLSIVDTVGEIAGRSRQAVMSRTKREVRVAAHGFPRSQASRRATFKAAAVATCCRWVLEAHVSRAAQATEPDALRQTAF